MNGFCVCVCFGLWYARPHKSVAVLFVMGVVSFFVWLLLIMCFNWQAQDIFRHRFKNTLKCNCILKNFNSSSTHHYNWHSTRNKSSLTFRHSTLECVYFCHKFKRNPCQSHGNNNVNYIAFHPNRDVWCLSLSIYISIMWFALNQQTGTGYISVSIYGFFS